MSNAQPPADHTSAPPLRSGWLDVGDGHRIRFEESGCVTGLPALLLHGGPGSSSTVRQREQCDPSRYRVIQFDQRGCGLSTPAGETAHNHADALICDIESLRLHLGIDRWLVCGGSWGSSLAIAYAARHLGCVTGLLLRGVFLTSHADLDWFFHGVAAFAPQANADFMKAIPARWQRRASTWLARCFAAGDSADARRVAVAWQIYEQRLDAVRVDADVTAASSDDDIARLVAKYRVQAHYLARRCFLGEPALMRAANQLHSTPVAIVHGTRDLVCRPRNAWRVHRTIAGSRLCWADGDGHNPFQPVSSRLLRAATDAFANDGDFNRWQPA